ncbi:MFS transporter [Berryella wangjianweii]|uniref:MFS transporter n=1 Tax=Berryella wangjianweii TaxID=2734634 RepID=A0A6M8J0F3_9ACTN|nr:MFS transporter [Berryella wangjianweii]NPD32670.1 MFS transporter [Eggerthellaceae bacterium zg-997]QKF07047.1 MFS transporter [Berryella wangjianweii]
MSLLAKSRGEVTYQELSSLHKWALVVLISMGSSIIYAPMYLKNVFYDPLMQALGATNAELGLMVSAYGIAAMVCYLPSGIVADKFRMRTLAWVGFLATALLVFAYATLPSVAVCLALFVMMGVTTILVWWGTRFKVIRLCCEENEYASKIGISYSIYGVTGLVIGLINAGIIASVSGSLGVQAMLVFLGAVIAVLGVIAYFIIPDFKGEINRDAKLFSAKEALQAARHPGVIWACVAYFCVYAVYQGATYTTPYLTQAFGADGNLVNVVGLIRTYGIGLIAGPVVGFIATKIKSPSKAILGGLVLSMAVLVGLIVFPHDPAAALTASILVVVFGFTTYGAFSIGSSPLSEVKIPMSIFGTATGILSVIGFLPDVFIHTWYGNMIDAQGVDAFAGIFGFEIMFGAIGCICLVMMLRSVKRHSATETEDRAA